MLCVRSATGCTATALTDSGNVPSAITAAVVLLMCKAGISACSTAARSVAATCWPRSSALTNAAVRGYRAIHAWVTTYPEMGKFCAAPWLTSNSGTAPTAISAADSDGSAMNAASTRCTARAAPMAGNGTGT